MTVEPLLARLERLKAERRPWDDHWERLAEVMHPRRLGFTSAQTAGARRTTALYDSTPMQAARGLAAAVDGLLKPKTARWFMIAAADDDLDELEEVQLWLRHVEDRMYDAVYAPRARFSQASAETDYDLVAFGTGLLYIGEGADGDGLMFASQDLAQAYIATDAEGAVNTLFRTRRFTARQAADFFERRHGGGVPEGAARALAADRPDTPLDYVHAVMPRRERLRGRADSRNLPIAGLWIEVETKSIALEAGFHEFPFAVPRWDTASGEVYGRSPGMVALPDANTLQAMGKTLLKAGQHAVIPPLFAPSDSIVGEAKLISGGVTYYDLDAAVGQRIAQPIFPLNNGANIPLGREMQNDVRELVWNAFFRGVLQLPVGGPQMTATEVIERKEEFTRLMAPVFGRLEGDYLAPVVERAFGILFRAGAFGPPPDVLRGRDIRFEYRSPIEQVRKQIDALAATRTIEQVAAVAAIDPAATDLLDVDAYVRLIAEANGSTILRPSDEVAGLRAARAEEAAAAQGVADLERALGLGADVAAKAPDLASLLSGGFLPGRGGA